MSTGTTGDGFIMWHPMLSQTNTTAVTTTTSASVGGTGTAFSAFTNLQTLAFTKIPYNDAQLTGGNVQGRLVSGCIKVRYSGSEDTRSGIVSLFEDPDHLSVTAQTATSISSFESCGKERVSGDGEWHSVNWSGPAKQNEQEYVGSATYTGNPCVVIAINGTLNGAGAGGPAPFEFEAWENLEYIGRDVVGKTDNQLAEEWTKKIGAAAKSIASQSNSFNAGRAGEFLRAAGLSGNPNARSQGGAGTMAGDALSAAAHAINPSLGRAWEWGRNFVARFPRRGR